MIESVQLWLRKSFAGFPWNWPDWCERERSIMTTPVLREVNPRT